MQIISIKLHKLIKNIIEIIRTLKLINNLINKNVESMITVDGSPRLSYLTRHDYLLFENSRIFEEKNLKTNCLNKYDIEIISKR